VCVCAPEGGQLSFCFLCVRVSPTHLFLLYCTNEVASQNNNNNRRLHPSQRHLDVSPRFPSGPYFETFSNDMLLMVVKCLPMPI
jgi:hypothetical protein